MPTPESAVTAMIRRPEFLAQPGAHLMAQRDSESMAEKATAVHGPYRADSDHNSPWWWVAALLLLCLIPAAPTIAEWVK